MAKGKKTESVTSRLSHSELSWLLVFSNSGKVLHQIQHLNPLGPESQGDQNKFLLVNVIYASQIIVVMRFKE